MSDYDKGNIFEVSLLYFPSQKPSMQLFMPSIVLQGNLLLLTASCTLSLVLILLAVSLLQHVHEVWETWGETLAQRHAVTVAVQEKRSLNFLPQPQWADRYIPWQSWASRSPTHFVPQQNPPESLSLFTSNSWGKRRLQKFLSQPREIWNQCLRLNPCELAAKTQWAWSKSKQS